MVVKGMDSESYSMDYFTYKMRITILPILRWYISIL